MPAPSSSRRYLRFVVPIPCSPIGRGSHGNPEQKGEPLHTSTSSLELNRKLAQLRSELSNLRRCLHLAVLELVQNRSVHVSIADVSDDGSEKTRFGDVDLGALDEFC